MDIQPEGDAMKVLQSHDFECAECGLVCTAKKIAPKKGELKVVVTHPAPSCGLFLSSDEAAFMQAAFNTRLEKARIAAEEVDTTPEEFKEAGQH
jgi:uncharacterized Zn finger protein